MILSWCSKPMFYSRLHTKGSVNPQMQFKTCKFALKDSHSTQMLIWHEDRLFYFKKSSLKRSQTMRSSSSWMPIPSMGSSAWEIVIKQWRILQRQAKRTRVLYNSFKCKNPPSLTRKVFISSAWWKEACLGTMKASMLKLWLIYRVCFRRTPQMWRPTIMLENCLLKAPRMSIPSRQMPSCTSNKWQNSQTKSSTMGMPCFRLPN